MINHSSTKKKITQEHANFVEDPLRLRKKFESNRINLYNKLYIRTFNFIFKNWVHNKFGKIKEQHSKNWYNTLKMIYNKSKKFRNRKLD